MIKDNRMKKPDSIEIAMIGYTQSGKTTLAVGLYATSTEDFSVAGVGADTETYLKGYRAALESGEWLSATTDKDKPTISLSINRKGKTPVLIEFKDYMGESAAKNLDTYKRDCIGDPVGAMILLNPGMKILQDPLTRSEMISGLKDIIQYLSEPDKKCKCIAVVVTASDILNVDEENKKVFEGCKAEIVNFLSTSEKYRKGKSWDEFEVTVTGKLEDPNKPRLARGKENTSRKPFEWLLERIEQEAKMCSIKKLVSRFFVISVAFLSICCATFASWYFWFDREAERNVEKIASAYGDKLDKAIADGKSSDINKHCNAISKELSETQTNSVFFKTNQARLLSSIRNLEDRIENGRLSWYPLEILRFEKELVDINAAEGLLAEEYKNRLERISDFEKKLAKFSVKTEGADVKLGVIQSRWKESRARIIDALELGCCLGCRAKMRTEVRESEKMFLVKNKIIESEPRLKFWKSFIEDYGNVSLSVRSKDFDAMMEKARIIKTNLFERIDCHNAAALGERIAEYGNMAEDKASEQICCEWRRSFEIWVPLSPKNGRELHKNLLKKFDESKRSWRIAYESKCYANGSAALLAKIGKAVLNLDDGNSINESLVECKKYELLAQKDDAAVLVDFETRKSTWNKIKKERQRLLEALLKSQVARIKPKTATPPCVPLEDVKFLDEVFKSNQAVSDDEYEQWKSRLNTEVGKLRKEWEAWQSKNCNDFIDGIKGSTAAYDTLKKFETFYSHNPYAPRLKEVVKAVDEVVVARFAEIVSETKSYANESCPWISGSAPGMREREKRMNGTLSSLREISRASVRVGDKCSMFKETKAYKYASACQSKGNIDGGVMSAFRQRYEISKIEVKFESTSLQFNFKHMSFAAFKVALGDTTNDFEYSPIVSEVNLGKERNGKWCSIWSGCEVVEGSPWRDALFALKVTDVNSTWGAEDKSGVFRLKFDGESFLNGVFEDEGVLNTGRLTGDSNPKISVRIHGRMTGHDFFNMFK